MLGAQGEPIPALKNIRQETFVREYLKCGVGADAYQRAYPRAARNTAGRNAWYLLNRNMKVPVRLTELRQELLKKSDITIERILTDFQEALDLAKKQQRPGDIINAQPPRQSWLGCSRTALNPRLQSTKRNPPSR